ncbi:MAG: class I SAM-dependent methyltransferase [Chloroflexi bacterium]|nr:class I SAM-dependent methyltransferase [Chloroflexota bacterium]
MLNSSPPISFDENYQYFQQIARAGKFSVPWWSARFYARLVRRYAPKITETRRVLDIGCAFGWVLQNLARDFELHGVDISEYAIRLAREKLPRANLRVGDASTLRDFPDAHFDALVSKHVFEHLANPAKTLRECARVLKRGGVLIFGTPNADNPLKNLKGAQWIGVKDPSHISVLPSRKWIALTRAAGLRVARAFSDGWWDVPYVARVPAFLQLFIFAIPAAVQVLIGIPFIPVRWGESVIVIARKE